MGGAATLAVIYSDGSMDSTMAYNSAMSDLSTTYELIASDDRLERDKIIRDWMTENQGYMDKEYGRPGLVPEWYGLIVIDNKNKKFLSMQGYTSLCEVSVVSLKLIADSSYDGNEWTQMEKFLSAGRLKLVRSFPEGEVVPKKFVSLYGIIQYCDKHNIRFGTCQFDMNGWEKIEFEESKKGLESFYQYCKTHYPLTASEIENWEKQIKEYD